ncbi:hypothetical protein [Mediterraneibacter gnavus]|uniref:hypothetical protein n=1 Tax=Mediterraneibacter gnavus TaxID=33038 RepID=UPI0032BFB919
MMIIIQTITSEIGLDRTIIGNFEITGIDFERALSFSEEKVSIECSGENLYYLKDGHAFSRLKIVDNYMFGVCTVYMKCMNGTRFVYASMDISIGTVRETNFQNQTMEEFKLRLDTIREYLVNKYGVVADFMQATFKNLEINVTLPLKHKFKEYHRVFNLMMYNVVLRNSKPTLEFKAENKKNAEQEVTGICKKNNCLEVKIYDKARQLREQNKADLSGEYMRLEITLLTTRKIREVFGTNRVYQITNKMIEQYFEKQCRKLLIKPYEKWKKKNREQLKKMMEEHRGKSERNWKANLLKQCSNLEQKNLLPVLLDIDDLLQILKETDRHGNYQRDRRNLLQQAELYTVYLNQDSRKFEEIFSKLQQIFSKSHIGHICDVNACA